MYVYNGTIFLVSDKLGVFPDRKFITSTGIIIDNGPEMIRARLPNDNDMHVISKVLRRNGSGMAPIVYRV